jgi:hypothetical protein
MMERLIFVRNSLVALLFAIPAVVMLPRASHSLAVPALGFVWCLFFEYLYHRWFQHRPGTIFADKHHLHHATYRRENEEEHLNFGGHPIYVALLFVVNGAPLVAVDLIFHTRWFPPAMLIFVGYVIVMEDIHYRIHTGLWVPFNLGVKHHHGHHTMPPKNFNVFIPLFDYLLGTKE